MISLAIVGALFAISISSAGGAEHVLVIGVDGMSPQGIEQAETPALDALMRDGAYTMKARGVLPAKSSPNWASMLMGAGPEQHGVTSNAWVPIVHSIAPTVKGPGGIFPAIVSVLREQRPKSKIAIIHEWPGFGILFEHKLVDFSDSPGDEEQTTAKAVEYLRSEKPTLLVVHLDLVDHALHEHGFLSAEYLAAITKADGLIAHLLGALAEAGIRERTLVHVLADHGGRGKDHGGETMQELEIPWIVEGPGIARGRVIETPVSICDSAPTIASALGLRCPEAWTGRPVTEAFE